MIINKPKGVTSFGVVAEVKRYLNLKKIGHCGTLDPEATGVLPLLLGRATKALSFLPQSQKEYVAEFKLGLVTDTQDITGKVIRLFEKKNKKFAQKAEVVKALNEFMGESLQIPPMYSALKQSGKRLYELARAGLEIPREARPIYIDKIKLLKFCETRDTGSIFVSCSKGTYIRTICHDLGEKLGCGAVLNQLIRLKSSGFSLKESLPLAKLKEQPELALTKILPTATLFSNYPRVYVSSAQAVRFCNGGRLALERVHLENVNGSGVVCVYDQKESFLGLGNILTQMQELGVLKVFAT